jgi:hypothetical protein
MTAVFDWEDILMKFAMGFISALIMAGFAWLVNALNDKHEFPGEPFTMECSNCQNEISSKDFIYNKQYYYCPSCYILLPFSVAAIEERRKQSNQKKQ